jgi:rhodanese-related sulfurtransferase
MAELLKLMPGAQRTLFRQYHIGGCSSCGFKPEETLADICERNNGLDPLAVIEVLQKGHEADELLMVDPSELKEWLEERPDKVKLLDVRTREEFEATRIERSELMSQNTLRDILTGWPRENVIVVIDHLGERCLDGAAYFLGQGFTNVRCLRGGLDAWSVQIDPKVRRYRLS